MTLDYEKLWRDTLNALESSVSKANFSAWFKDTSIDKCENGVVFVNVPNNLVCEWLSKKFANPIVNALRNIDNTIRHVNFIASPIQAQNQSKQEKNNQTENNQDKNQSGKLKQPENGEQMKFTELCLDTESNLNPNYTFNSFIVASFNEVAHAAALTVSKSIGNIYNPLFIYGGVGLGKTHLLQSIGNEIKKNNPTKKVFYLTSEKFATEYVTSIQNNNVNTFKEKYRKYDLLIVDDIQFFSEKLKIQEEFFHVFNTLYNKNNQIVFSSDKPPHEIVGLEDRLRSRFEGGMMVDISQPEYEARIAILKNKLIHKKFELSDEIIEHIASLIKENIRELEGALNSIIGQSKIKNKELSIEDVNKILNKKIRPVKVSTANNLIKSISLYFNIEQKSLSEKTRKQEVVKPRQIAMYLLRNDLNTSYPHIGRILGQKDHTTAIHAFKKISKDIKIDKKLEQEVNKIREIMFKNCA